MSPAENEFTQLKQRYKKALEYEKTKYLTDTSEGQAWAEKEMINITRHMAELWEQMTEEEKKRHRDLFEIGG